MAHAANELYSKPRTDRQEFVVTHYTGPTTYNVLGFIEKNKDVVRGDMVELLVASGNMVSRTPLSEFTFLAHS